VKKLLLIPTVVLTAFLALAFLMPATAANVIRSVAPAAQISLSNRSETLAAAPASKVSASRVSSSLGSQTSAEGSTTQLLVSSPAGHDVGTAGEMNCGRFGNGFHGGKHDFICPNRPFPQPPNP
jgi:hypothetical protein